MNTEEQLKAKCPNCGDAEFWYANDSTRDWHEPGDPRGPYIGERWHCGKCDHWLIIQPYDGDHTPTRGSEVERWIMAHLANDEYDNRTGAEALESLLESYRHMADEGYTIKEARLASGDLG